MARIGALFMALALAASACTTPSGSVSGSPPGDTGSDATPGDTDSTSGGASTDIGACAAKPPGDCCCTGDVAGQILCTAGQWTCSVGSFYMGEQCNGLPCGGPCSLPCPMDAGSGSGDSIDESNGDATMDASTDTVSDIDGDSAGDAIICAGGPPGDCCCSGDQLGDILCQGGKWTCSIGWFYSGNQCNSVGCGGPCSLPCMTDAGASSASPDTGEADAGGVDAPTDASDVVYGQVGAVCGQDGSPPCDPELVCCYPCGIPGCQNQCTVPCTGVECVGGCMAVP